MAIGDLILISKQTDDAFADIPPETFRRCLFEIVDEISNYLFVRVKEYPRDGHESASHWFKSQRGQYVRRENTELFTQGG